MVVATDVHRRYLDDGVGVPAATGINMSPGPELSDEERRAFEAKLASLRIEHRDLDDVTTKLEAEPDRDELQVRRIKKRKLLLKDQIRWIERQLDPDTLA